MSNILIVGLGNPEAKHARNRHNIGFMVLDALAHRHQVSFQSNDAYKSMVAAIPPSGNAPRVDLLKPTTFMNASGEAVRLFTQFYKVEPRNLWVVHDDLDLPFGMLKIQRNISAAGHNGIHSIIDQLHRQDFWRFRFGIGRPESELDQNRDGTVDVREHAMAEYQAGDYVLADFDAVQAPHLEALITGMVTRLEAAITAGDPLQAANQFNGGASTQKTAGSTPDSTR